MWDAFYDDLDLWCPDHFHASARGHALFARAAIPVAEAALNGSVRFPVAHFGDGDVRFSKTSPFT
jgi:hypothetical protein